MTRLLRGSCLCGGATYDARERLVGAAGGSTALRAVADERVGEAVFHFVLDGLPQHDELP